MQESQKSTQIELQIKEEKDNKDHRGNMREGLRSDGVRPPEASAEMGAPSQWPTSGKAL